MLSNLKPEIEQRLEGLGKSLKWLNPNTLTIIGIIPQALFLILMNSGHFIWAAVALALSAIDMLDGLIARANDKVTAFGGFLDSTLDRLSDFMIIAGFYAGNLISLNIAAILLVTTYLISYVRSRAELAAMGKIKFNHGLIERPERIIFLFLTLILYIIWPHAAIFGISLVHSLIWVLTALSIVTLLQRVWYAYKKL